MAAEFESGFFVVEPPWHNLGVTLPNAPDNWEDAAREAGLTWAVEKRPVQFVGNNGSNIEVPDKFVVVRDMDESPLGTVGKDWTAVQNVDAFKFFDEVVGAGAATYETAGSLQGGRTVFVLARLNGELEIVKDDIVRKYLLFSNAHDGSKSVRILTTPIRVVCANTLAMAIGGSTKENRIYLRHTKNVVEFMKDAAETLGVIDRQFDSTAQAFKMIARKKVTAVTLNEYLLSVVPDPDSGKNVGRNNNVREKMVELFESGRGSDIKAARGTLWSAYNAVTEYVDHVRDDGKDDKRVRSMWFGNGFRLKQHALTVAVDMAVAA